MPLLKKIKLSVGSLLLLLCVCYHTTIKAQCTGCTTLITSPASTNFSVNAGQVVCINAGVTYTGNITLNGGTLCNNGTLTRVVFKVGKFNNYGTYKTTGGLSIVNTGNLLINCYSKSTFSVTGGISIRSINVSDSVVINSPDSAKFTTNTNFTVRNTKLKIYNGHKNGYPQSIFNVGTDFTVGDSADFKLNNYNDFNVGRNINLSATGNKTINNFNSSFTYFDPSTTGTSIFYNNIFNVNGSFNISGVANVGDKVNVINYGSVFQIAKNLTSSIQNANVRIINKSFLEDPNTAPAINIGQSLTLSNTTDSLINLSALQANIITISKGIFVNNANVYSNTDLKITNGKVINNPDPNGGGITFIYRNLLISSQGSFENNSSVNVFNDVKVTSGTLTNSSEIDISHDLILQTTSQSLNTGTIIATNNLQVIGSTFTNSNTATAGKDVLIQTNATATNSGTLTATRNVKLTSATLTNNNYVLASNNLNVSNSIAIYNNNGYTEVRDSLYNVGLTNLGQKSFISTVNYYNVSTGTISAPASVPDTASYAKLIISGLSNNTSYINGKVIVHDQTLVSTTSNIGYGFDQISNVSRIANAVLFASIAVAPSGSAGFVKCGLTFYLYSIKIFPKFLPPICSGDPVNLSAQFQLIGGGNVTIPSNSYTWQPGNLIGQFQTFFPTSNITYTISVKYLNCTFTSQKVVTVINNIVTVIPTNTTIVSGSNVYLQSTIVSGTAPFSYLWLPNTFFTSGTNNTQANPIVAPTQNVTYTLQVTDVNGCKAFALSNVFMPSYNVLKKELDGSYYNTINGNLFFTIDGEYNNMGINYTIYNYQRTPITGLTINSTNFKTGDNRYSINVSTLSNGYYVLEVINQKNEKRVLRFLK